MKLRSRGVVLSLSLMLMSLSATTLSIAQSAYKVKGEGEQIEVSDLLNITISNKRVVKNTDGSDSVVFNYTVAPTESEGYSFDDFLNWSSKPSDEYESADWGSGEDPYSYVETKLDETKKEISLHCLKPFGRALEYTLVCKENTAVKASLSIDYGRKVLNKGGVKFSTTKFTDGVPIKMDITRPTYSIGSKGEKKDFVAEVKEIKFEKGNSLFKTWEELFPTIQVSNTEDTNNIYYDVDLDGIPEKASITTARAKMMERSFSYLANIIRSNGVQKFTKNNLISILSYRVKAYNDQTTPYTDVATRLIYNYKIACSKGGGLFASLHYDGVLSSKNCFEFDFNAANISNVSLGFTGIEF